MTLGFQAPFSKPHSTSSSPVPRKRAILVLSNLHLGRHGMVLDAKELTPLVEEAGTLIVNGDTAELHVTRYRDRAVAEFAHLREICAANDTRLLLLAGNHDPTLVQERYIIHEQQGVFITHGDVVSDAVAPWSEAADRMRKRHHEVTAEFSESERNSLDGAFMACREAAVAEWNPRGDAGLPSTAMSVLFKPRTLVRVINFWRTQARLMDAFAERFVPSARLILIGHSHRPLIRKFRKRVVVNTGCYGFPGHPIAGIFDSTGFRVQRIVRKNDCWTLSSRMVYEDQSISFDESSLSEAIIGPKADLASTAAASTAARSTPVFQPASSH